MLLTYCRVLSPHSKTHELAMNYASFATYIETDHSSHLKAKCNVFHGTIHCSVKFPFYAIADGTNTAASMYLYFAFHLTNTNLVHSH